MPDPRPLGNNAKTILDWMNAQNMADSKESLEIMRLAAAKDIDAIMNVAANMAYRNMLAVQVGTYLNADQFQRADNVIMTDVIQGRKAQAS